MYIRYPFLILDSGLDTPLFITFCLETSGSPIPRCFSCLRESMCGGFKGSGLVFKAAGPWDLCGLLMWNCCLIEEFHGISGEILVFHETIFVLQLLHMFLWCCAWGYINHVQYSWGRFLVWLMFCCLGGSTTSWIGLKIVVPYILYASPPLQGLPFEIKCCFFFFISY